MKPAVTILGLIALCLLAGVGSYYVNSRQTNNSSQVNQGDCPISLEGEVRNLGELWETDLHKFTLTVVNRGTVDAEVLGIGTSCGCLTVSPNSFALAPQESRELQAVVNLVKAPKSDSGDVRLMFRPQVKAGERKYKAQWDYTAVVRKALRVPAVISLGTHSDLASIEPWTAEIYANVPLMDLHAECSTPGASVAIQAHKNTLSCYTVTITPRTRMPIQSLDGEVIFSAKTMDGVAIPSTKVPLQGRIVSDVKLEPEDLLFGGKRIGEMFTEDCSLSSLSGKERYTLLAIRAVGDGLKVEKLNANQLRVTQSISHSGSNQTEVELDVIGSEGKQQTIRLPVRYVGLRAARE